MTEPLLWSADGRTLTLKTGKFYNSSIAPTEALCDSHVRVNPRSMGDPITRENVQGVLRHRSYLHPHIDASNQYGPVLGLVLVPFTNEHNLLDIMLVGTPTEPITDLRFEGTRTCYRGSEYFSWGGFGIVITGDAIADGERHYGHHHLKTAQRLDSIERHLRSIAIHLAPDNEDLHPSLHWTNEVLGRE